jgi:hypothetical protein
MSGAAAALQATPIYADMVNRIKVDDSVKGTPVLTITRTGPAVESGASGKPKEGPQAESKEGGGLAAVGREAGRALGLPRFGRRDEKPAAKPPSPMTIQQEIVSFARTVSDGEVAIPTAFKQVNPRGR